jgi:hypothetical protein
MSLPCGESHTLITTTKVNVEAGVCETKTMRSDKMLVSRSEGQLVFITAATISKSNQLIRI